MTYYNPELGSGEVDYTPNRVLVHFGTPPEVVKAQYDIDRLRSRGFLLTKPEQS